MTSSTDRIEKQVLIKAPGARVWRALANAEEFGTWFGVALEGKRFAVGQHVQGHITYPGYEHLVFDILVERIEPERLLSFRWHPAAIDTTVDYSTEPTTLVVFELAPAEGGTLLRVVESGFDALPEARRATAFRLNASGWEEQMHNIDRHVGAA
jgi:uncharacterized protein YndB with AHSA1/START domain